MILWRKYCDDNLILHVNSTQCREERRTDSRPFILYSSLILLEERLVMSGAVWRRLYTGQLVQSVGGHDGLMFSVGHQLGHRSSIIYKCSQTFTEIQQVPRLWSNMARVFRLGLSQEDIVQSLGGREADSLGTGERLEIGDSDIHQIHKKNQIIFKKYDNCLYIFSTYCDIIKESSFKHQHQGQQSTYLDIKRNKCLSVYPKVMYLLDSSVILQHHNFPFSPL